MVVSLSASAAGAASGGSLSGVVVDGAGDPISGICVNVDGGPGVQTDATGAYQLDGLAAGAYRLQYSDCNPSPRYVSQWYLGHTDQSDANTVTVVDLVDTTLSTVTLDPGVVVQGTVTDGDGAPLADVNVNVNPTGSGSSGWAQTGVDGSYSTTPVPSGSYRVQFSPSDASHATQFWNDQRSWNTADPLTLSVADGPVRSGIDAQLSSSATVEGTVTGTDGSGLAGICVDANVPTGNGWDGIGGTTTGPDGTYTLTGLSPGDVRVHFRDCGAGPHVDQWYSGRSDFNSSTPVVLAPEEIRSGVDATLGAGTSVSGTVTDSNGDPIPNVSVNVNPTGSGASGWAQTDGAGQYTTNALPPGNYRVQFQGTAAFAGEYWNDEPSWNTADILTIGPGDGPVHSGIDASLATGAGVSGLVTGPDGQPVGNICVTANIDTAQGVDWVGGASTAPDGSYTIGGLPARGVKVDFRDCNTVGPYVEQWWNDRPDPDHAVVVTLAPGATQTGIDARLAAAGAITGTVTDGGGHPLSGICAQATTDSFVGGLAGTDSSGHYSIVLAKPGAYRVQFVDCNQPPTYAGQWWSGKSGAASADLVNVAESQVVTGIDAVLVPGSAGSISGRVLTARGTGMTTSCVIAYLPTQFAIVGLVQPDGSYTIPDVPSGTYALAFLGCPGGDPSPTVADPDVSGVSYQATWWRGVPLDISGSANGGPDPIAQGADLVTVAPGQARSGYDTCFGCDAIGITSVRPGPNTLTVAFTPPDINRVGHLTAQAAGSVPGTVQAQVQADAIAYTVTCTPVGGGQSARASGSGSPVVVTGLLTGTPYTCQVLGAVGGTVVATSVVSGAATVPAATAKTTGETASNATDAGGFAFTGAASTVPLARFGTVLLVLGLLLAGATRVRRRAPVCLAGRPHPTPKRL